MSHHRCSSVLCKICKVGLALAHVFFSVIALRCRALWRSTGSLCFYIIWQFATCITVVALGSTMTVGSIVAMELAMGGIVVMANWSIVMATVNIIVMALWSTVRWALGSILNMALGGIVDMAITVTAMGAFFVFFAITVNPTGVHGLQGLSCHVRNIITAWFWVSSVLTQSMVFYRRFSFLPVIPFSILTLLSRAKLVPCHCWQGHHCGNCILYIPLVSLHMQRQVVRAREGLVALLAHIRALSCVPPNVSRQLVWAPESPTTAFEGTTVGFLPGVCPSVSLQVAAFGVALVAPFPITWKDSLPSSIFDPLDWPSICFSHRERHKRLES